MIRVTVELVSANGRHRDRILGTAEIANDGTGTVIHGNYRARFYGAHRPQHDRGIPAFCGWEHGKLWRETTLRGWARNRWHPWLLILFLLLKAVGPELFEKVSRPLRKSGGDARRQEAYHPAHEEGESREP